MTIPKNNILTRRMMDMWALSFGGIFIAEFFLNILRYPTELDTTYHLLMGKILSQHGLLFRHDILEFAPYGRYLGYPPLLHWMIACLRMVSSLDFFVIARIIVSFQVILFLAGIWYFARRYFGPCAAFAALVFSVSVSDFWWWQTSVAPVALAHAFFWPAIILFLKKRWPWVLLLTTASFYLHMGFPYIMISIMAVFSIWQFKEDRIYAVRTAQIVIAALLLSLPQFLYFSKGYLSIFDPAARRAMAPALFSGVQLGFVAKSLSVIFWAFIIIGIYDLLIRRARGIRTKEERIVIASFFVLSLSSIFFYGSTRFHSQFPLAGALVAGIGFKSLAEFFTKRSAHLQKTKLAVLSILLLITSSFVEKVYISDVGCRAMLAPFGNQINSIVTGSPLASKHPYRIQDFLYRKDADYLTDYIRTNIPKDEIIHMSNGALACYITLVTERLTDWGMFWEYLSEDSMRKIIAGRTRGYFIFQDDKYEAGLLFSGHEELFEKQGDRIIRIGRYRILRVP